MSPSNSTAFPHSFSTLGQILPVEYNVLLLEWPQENESKLLLLQWPTQSPDLNSKTEEPHATRYLIVWQQSGIEKALFAKAKNDMLVFKEGPQELLKLKQKHHFSRFLDPIIHLHTKGKNKHLKHWHFGCVDSWSQCLWMWKSKSNQWEIKHRSQKWHLLCI